MTKIVNINTYVYHGRYVRHPHRILTQAIFNSRIKVAEKTWAHTIYFSSSVTYISFDMETGKPVFGVLFTGEALVGGLRLTWLAQSLYGVASVQEEHTKHVKHLVAELIK